jgi:hypothetical protein
MRRFELGLLMHGHFQPHGTIPEACSRHFQPNGIPLMAMGEAILPDENR